MMIAAELDWIAPQEAHARLAGEGVALLDSSAPRDPRSQASYLCLAPDATLTLQDAPFATLRGFLAAHRPAALPDWPLPFKGGAVGWIGYDLARAAAGVDSRFAPLPGLPGGWFGLYTTLLGFDHASQRLYYLGPAARLAGIRARLAAPPPAAPALPPLAWAAEMGRDSYLAGHEALRAYIRAGDVYQANFTLRFSAPRPAAASLPALHRALRRLSPAPFAAVIDIGNAGLVSASPERFLRLAPDGQVETRPIKGTAPRAADPAQDAANAAALRASAKERAENLMITDLLRNDLGQVCVTGSIQVPELFAVEPFAQAHHLVSAVTGRLRPGLDACDLLAATMPGGSITGAPKRRAMQIIDGLEHGPRGAYCGTIAWLGFDGAMDSAIIIRTMTATAETLYAQAGGGITWESAGPLEYEEAMLKLSPLLALGHG